MNNVDLQLTAGNLKISYETDASSGSISSSIKVTPHTEACAAFNSKCEALESIVLAHFLGGIDVQSDSYLEGLDIAFETAKTKYNEQKQIKKPNLKIEFDNWLPNPEKPGYLSYSGPKTHKEIQSQIEKALKEIVIAEGDDQYSAYEAAEWVSMHGKHTNEEVFVPRHFRPIVFYRNGNCEGYIIEIHLQDHDGEQKFHPVCSAKFLIKLNDVRKITDALIEACE